MGTGGEAGMPKAWAMTMHVAKKRDAMPERRDAGEKRMVVVSGRPDTKQQSPIETTTAPSQMKNTT